MYWATIDVCEAPGTTMCNWVAGSRWHNAVEMHSTAAVPWKLAKWCSPTQSSCPTPEKTGYSWMQLRPQREKRQKLQTVNQTAVMGYGWKEQKFNTGKHDWDAQSKLQHELWFESMWCMISIIGLLAARSLSVSSSQIKILLFLLGHHSELYKVTVGLFLPVASQRCRHWRQQNICNNKTHHKDHRNSLQQKKGKIIRVNSF